MESSGLGLVGAGHLNLFGFFKSLPEWVVGLVESVGWQGASGFKVVSFDIVFGGLIDSVGLRFFKLPEGVEFPFEFYMFLVVGFCFFLFVEEVGGSKNKGSDEAPYEDSDDSFFKFCILLLHIFTKRGGNPPFEDIFLVCSSGLVGVVVPVVWCTISSGFEFGVVVVDMFSGFC